MTRQTLAGAGCLAVICAALLMPAVAVCAPQPHALFEPPAEEIDLGPNLLLKAKVQSSPWWSTCVPEYAVDGKRDAPSPHWAAENIPVWLTVELPGPRQLNLIRLWTFWDNRRYYQYCVEGSLDGETWTLLGDRRDNTAPATSAPAVFAFPSAELKFVRVTFTHNSVGNVTGGHIVEIEGFSLDEARAKAFGDREALWADAEGLMGSVGSVDERYVREVPPGIPAAARTKQWSAVAWRGERVHCQLALWTRDGARQVRLVPTGLKSEAGGVIPAACIVPRFVRYVLADGRLVADILDDADRLDIPGHTTRPVWVSVNVPATAAPGVYTGRLDVLAAGGLRLPFDLRVEVLSATLPEPAAWRFRLDLWQNPFAVARYHRVPLWSEAHLKLLEPHLRLLAGAGQKCITASIIHRPWGTQTYDPYESMIQWGRAADGKWSYDYAIFDRWVELCMACGITDSINCYTVSSPRYLDEASGDYTAGGMSLEDIWRPFLADFRAHLRDKGWLAKTALAMDEWPLDRMKPMLEFLRREAPDLKIALAGSNEPELGDAVDDWCVFITPPLDPAIAHDRAVKGLPTTYYVCCGPGRPNTFTFSPPAESAWLGWYAAAQGYSGLLRWAYDSWVADPLYDTSHVTWAAGDCFLVYPNARSSIRFERLREGIQRYEQVRIVREALGGADDPAARAALGALEEALGRFSYAQAQTEPAAEPVNAATAALQGASRLMGE